jgi:hypothetical protein
MSRSANVLSVQTLKDFKVVMCNFAEEARNSLSGVDMELRRMRDWLERDQLGYWTAQVKRRQEELMQARADLHKRKISQQGSDAVSDAEQKEALREAQRRLRVAEEKVDLIKKKLIPYLHHESAEYRARAQPLGDHLVGGFEKSLIALEKMIQALESYLALHAPAAPKLDAGVESSGAATTVGASSGSAATTTAAEPSDTAGGDGQAAAKPDGTAEVQPKANVGEPLVSGRVS